MTTNFFTPLFCCCFRFRDPGSGIWDGQKSGSGIRDKHPGSATLLVSNLTLEERQCKFCIFILLIVLEDLFGFPHLCRQSPPHKRCWAKNRTLDLLHGRQARQQLSNFTHPH